MKERLSASDPTDLPEAHPEAERALFIGSALWMSLVAIVMVTGVLRSWSDTGYLAFSFVCAATVTVVPALLCKRDLPYVLKLNLFAFVLMVVGTYFGTHYFFDFMHMKYAFATKLALQSEQCGRSGQTVPLFMYPLTQAYFTTYFTALVAADRVLRKRLALGPVGSALVVLALSYGLAFLETFTMATGLMSDLFLYEKKGRMLAVGSIGYAIYFVIGLPLARPLGRASTTLGMTLMRALAAGMAILFALELWSRTIGPL